MANPEAYLHDYVKKALLINPEDWDSGHACQFLHELEQGSYDSLEACASSLVQWLIDKYDLLGTRGLSRLP